MSWTERARHDIRIVSFHRGRHANILGGPNLLPTQIDYVIFDTTISW